jgi:predicted aspartyl protease
MIEGSFDNEGQLRFEIDLVAANGLPLPVDAVLDTGSTEWLVINNQDLESFGWRFVGRRTVRTAQGETTLNVYAGKVILDEQEFDIPVVASKAIEEYLIRIPWLRTKRLVVDWPAVLLTLG